MFSFFLKIISCIFHHCLDLGIKVSPKEGRALVWNNMNDDGECETLSEHSANIVEDKQGKFVLQRW